MESHEIKFELKKKLEELKHKIISFFLRKKGNSKTYEQISDNNKKEFFLEYFKEKQKKYEQQIKEENENFIREKAIILKNKNERIKQIEADKKKEIDESNKKYRNIFTYLDSIKNDKNKLIEYFQSDIIV